MHWWTYFQLYFRCANNIANTKLSCQRNGYLLANTEFLRANTEYLHQHNEYLLLYLRPAATYLQSQRRYGGSRMAAARLHSGAAAVARLRRGCGGAAVPVAPPAGTCGCAGAALRQALD